MPGRRWDAQGNLIPEKRRWDAQGNLIGERPEDLGARMALRAWERVKSAPGAIAGAFGPPATDFESTIAPPSPDPMTTLGQRTALAAKRQFIDPSVEQFQQAAAASMRGDTAASIGHRVAGAVPVLGPMAAGYVKTGTTEGVPEALGELGADVAMAGLTAKGGGKSVGTLEKRAAALPAKSLASAQTEITRFLRPGRTDFKFETFRDRALPDIIAEGEALQAAMPEGQRPSTLITDGGDFLGLTRKAERTVFAAREAAVAPFKDYIKADSTKLAQAARRSITKEMRANPKQYAKHIADMEEFAAQWDGKEIPFDVADAQWHRWNAELADYYTRRKANTATAEESLPNQAKASFADALRDELHSKTEAVSGVDAADLMQRYGALKEMERHLAPIVQEIDRYGRPDLKGMAFETMMDTAAGGIYSRAGALVRLGRGVRKMLGQGDEAKLVNAIERLRMEPRPARGLQGPPKPTPLALPAGATRVGAPESSNVQGVPASPGVSTGQRSLGPGAGFDTRLQPPDVSRVQGAPAGYGAATGQRSLPPASFTPAPPRNVERGMQFEGKYPLENQSAPGAIPRTTPPPRPSGYVPATSPRPEVTLAVQALDDTALIQARQIAAQGFPDILVVIDAEIARRRGAAPTPPPRP